jgi:hypothetical protein
MKGFPDESKMERSQDGTEPIRGGSIGLNKILSVLSLPLVKIQSLNFMPLYSQHSPSFVMCGTPRKIRR